MLSCWALLLVLLVLTPKSAAFNLFGASAGRCATRSASRGALEMKGKGGRVPIDQRGEFLKKQRMMEQMQKMKESKASGVPVFKMFVRPKVGGLWVPCGDLQGDQRATALVNAWMSDFMTDMYKSQLDQGIAKSLFSQEDVFVRGLIENFKPFKKMKPDDLEFGYKVDFPGVAEKFGDKCMVLNREMQKGWLDNVQDKISSLFGGGNAEDK